MIYTAGHQESHQESHLHIVMHDAHRSDARFKRSRINSHEQYIGEAIYKRYIRNGEEINLEDPQFI